MCFCRNPTMSSPEQPGGQSISSEDGEQPDTPTINRALTVIDRYDPKMTPDINLTSHGRGRSIPLLLSPDESSIDIDPCGMTTPRPGHITPNSLAVDRLAFNFSRESVSMHDKAETVVSFVIRNTNAKSGDLGPVEECEENG